MEYLKAGIKQDTLASPRTAPLQMSALFLDHIISKSEEEICHHEDKHTSGALHRKSQHFHLYSQPSRQQRTLNPGPPALKQIRRRGQRSNSGKASFYSQRPAKSKKQYK